MPSHAIKPSVAGAELSSGDPERRGRTRRPTIE
jgi:hypothetical protein